MSGWPQFLYGQHAFEPWNMLTADIEPGGDLEIIYMSEASGPGEGTDPHEDIMIWRSDDSMFPGMPIIFHPTWERQSQKSMVGTIADLKNDGGSDLIHIKSYSNGFLGSELQILDYDGDFSNPRVWSTFQHDNSRTGLAE